jgi:hypothetical protein
VCTICRTELNLARIIDPAEYSDEEYKKILRKVDFILLPLMWWCYGIQQTDKTGLGTMVSSVDRSLAGC